MKFTTPALLLSLPALASAQLLPQVHLRYLSIEKTGAATALAAAGSADVSGTPLFDQLMADAADGQATVLADQEIITRSGQRSRVKAGRLYSVPITFHGSAPGGLILPSEFEENHYGQWLEVEATVSDGPLTGPERRGIDLNLAPERTDLVSFLPWPVTGHRGTGAGGDGMPRLALSSSLKTATQALTWTGNTALLSITPSATASLSAGGEPVFCYQFIRAGLNGETPAPPDARRTGPGFSERRIHAVTLRLPRQEAAALTLQADGNDAALYARLTGMAAAGAATLSGHSAIVCRNGQRSRIASCVHFPELTHFPGHGSLDMETRDLGESLEVEAEFVNPEAPADRVPGGWNAALERQSGLEMVSWLPDPSRPDDAEAMPEYLETKLSTQFRIPPSGILWAGAVSSSPATESGGPDAPGVSRAGPGSGAGTDSGSGADSAGGTTAEASGATGPAGAAGTGAPAAPGGTTELTFFLQTPPPGPAAEDMQPQIRLQALMFSLPPQDGAALAASFKAGGGLPLSAVPWINRFLRGEFPCAAQASCVGFFGQRSKVSGVRKIRQLETRTLTPPATAGTPAPAPFTGTSWERKDCGVSLTVEYSGGDQDPAFDLIWEWDTAPVLESGEPAPPPAGTGTGIRAGSSGSPAPAGTGTSAGTGATAAAGTGAGAVSGADDLDARRCRQTVSLKNLNLRPAIPVIADVRLSNARPGAAGHGRWNALVLLAR